MSRLLAPPFIAFAGLEDGERVLDVGCGTGSLTFALAQAAALEQIVSIDYSENFVEAARAKSVDPRIRIELADACALPFQNAAFDRCFSLLVLQFIPDSELAVAEMRRVVRPGGVVAAAVWDGSGVGRGTEQMFWAAAASADPDWRTARQEFASRPMTRANEMKTLWTRLGLREVEETTFAIQIDYASFDAYWSPIKAGQSTIGKYVIGLSDEVRARLEQALRADMREGDLTDHGRFQPGRGLVGAWSRDAIRNCRRHLFLHCIICWTASPKPSPIGTCRLEF